MKARTFTIPEERLFKWLEHYRKFCESTGKGTQHKTIREAAIRYHVRQDLLMEKILEMKSNGWPVDLLVAESVNGGFYSYDKIGDFGIETY